MMAAAAGVFGRALATLLALALLCGVRAQQPKGVNTDADIRQALLAQRDAITNWAAFKAANSIAGWDEAEPNVCAWNGVNCTDSGMVYRLDWSCDNCLHCPLIGEWDFNLCAQPHAQGRLAPELANIKSLRQIYIKGQNISGPLPDAWAAEGAFLNLTDLALENNSFTGSLPASWGRPGAFPNTWRIWLNDNELTGTLPPGWGAEGALKNLTWLKLHNNFLDGSVPAEWGQPTSFARMTSGTGNEGVCPTGIKASFQKCEITLANNTAMCGPVPPTLAPFVCAEDKGDEQRATCVAQPDGTQLLSNQTCTAAGGQSPEPAPAPVPSPSPSPAAPDASPSPLPDQQGGAAAAPPPQAADGSSSGGDTSASASGSDAGASSGSGGSSTNTGAIVGGVIGGLVVLGGAAFAFVKLRGHKSLQGWKKEALDGHGLPVHQTPPAAGAGNGSTTGGAVYQPARLPMEPEVPGFDGVEAAARQ